LQLHLVFAICTLVALGFVVDSTVKLYRYRRKNAQTLGKMAFRDFAILRRPNDFAVEEARLTYKNWISSLATLVLIALFAWASPEPDGAAGGDPPAVEEAPASGGAPTVG